MVPFVRFGRGRERAAYGAVAVAVAAVMIGGGVVAQIGLRGRAGPAVAAEFRALVAPCEATALPTLGGRWGNATAASSNGLVVGIAEDASGRSRPVLWRAGRAVALEIALDAVVPTGVNRSGAVVGTGYDSAAEMLVGWWWSGGTMHRLPVEPDDIALPEAIDDSGRIVGALIEDEEHSDGPGADENERAALWVSTKTLPRELPAAAGDDTAHAFAIAPDGTIGGVSMGRTAAGALWDLQGRVQRLPNLDDAAAGLVRGFDSQARPVGDAAAAGGGSPSHTISGRPHQAGPVPALRRPLTLSPAPATFRSRAVVKSAKPWSGSAASRTCSPRSRSRASSRSRAQRPRSAPLPAHRSWLATAQTRSVPAIRLSGGARDD